MQPITGEQVGHVRRDSGCDEDLLRTSDEVGKTIATGRVELGEDVVEHEHRLTTGTFVVTKQVVRRQLERQCVGPLLAVRRLPLGRRLPQS